MAIDFQSKIGAHNNDMKQMKHFACHENHSLHRRTNQGVGGCSPLVFPGIQYAFPLGTVQDLPGTPAGFWGILRSKKTASPLISQAEKSSCPHSFPYLNSPK